MILDKVTSLSLNPIICKMGRKELRLHIKITACNFIYIYIYILLFRATPVAYGGSQARDQIGAAAAGLHQSHSNARSEPHLQSTPQLTATPDS